MKKYFFMVMTATFIMLSCSNHDDLVTGKEKMTLTAKIKFPSSKALKSGDNQNFNPGLPAPEWTELLLVVKDRRDNYIKHIITTKAELAGSGYEMKLEESTSNSDLIGGRIDLYAVTEGSDWLPLRHTKLPLLASDQLDINNWQASGEIETGVAGAFKNIPYHGTAIIEKRGIEPDGHIRLEADLSAAPILARIQVIGVPQGGAKDGYVVAIEKVTGVYINHITSNHVTQDIREGASSVVADWESKYYTGGISSSLVGMWDTSEGFGYHLFNGNQPQIIVKIDYSVNGGSTIIGKYLTITKFSYVDEGTSVTSGPLEVGNGKIYSVNLSDLIVTYDKTGDEPYDSTVYYDLVAKVTINPWKYVIVAPEL